MEEEGGVILSPGPSSLHPPPTGVVIHLGRSHDPGNDLSGVDWGCRNGVGCWNPAQYMGLISRKELHFTPILSEKGNQRRILRWVGRQMTKQRNSNVQ